MKSLNTLLAVVALSVGASAIVVHAEGTTTKKDKPAAGATEKKAPVVMGEITKIDGSTLTLATKVKPAKEGDKPTTEEKSVTLTDTVEVKIDGEKKTVGDLKVGEKAKVTLDGPDGKGIKVEVKTAAAPKKKEGASTK